MYAPEFLVIGDHEMLTDSSPEMRVNPFFKRFICRLRRLGSGCHYLIPVVGTEVLRLDESLNAILDHLLGQPVGVRLKWILGVHAFRKDPGISLNKMYVI